MVNSLFKKGGGFASLFLIIAGIFILQKLKGTSPLVSYSVGSLPNSYDHYKRLADKAFVAMKAPGTKTDDLFEVFENLSADELKAVYNAFGRKNYFLTGSSGFMADNGINLFGEKLDLFGWFKKEIKSKPKLSRMRGIWTSKNVEVTF